MTPCWKEKIDADSQKLAHQSMAMWRGSGLNAPIYVALYEAGQHPAVMAFDPAALPKVHEHAALYA